MAAHSQIAIGTDVSLMTRVGGSSLPVLHAFGEPDDHLRLSTLLAYHLRSCSEGLPAGQADDLRDAADACLRSSTPWPERHRLLEAVMRLARKGCGSRHLVGLVDIDGLNPGPLDAERRWNDHDFLRQRREFLDLVLRAIDEGGWLVLRPNPSRAISQRLTGISAEILTSPGAFAGVDLTQRKISPEQRPILTWLLRKGALEADDVEELLELGGPRGVQAHVVALAYDHLPPQARRAVDLLSALRPPQPVNGMVGPFRVMESQGQRHVADADAPEEAKLPAAAVRTLVECGFLQSERAERASGAPTGAFRMPRFVRAYVQKHVKARAPEALVREHAWLGESPLDAQPIAQQLETHFHAVQGGRADRARETARYYGSDLRQLGFQLSRLAACERDEQQRRLYREAAAIYALIVDRFDALDAYAWEYRGYNLARGYSERGPLPEAAREEILEAYKKAVEHEPSNPLYQGRLLGFRARLGEDVVSPFNERMNAYLELFEGKPEAVSYFAEPVLTALERCGDSLQRARIEEHWGSMLAHLRRRRLHVDR